MLFANNLINSLAARSEGGGKKSCCLISVSDTQRETGGRLRIPPAPSQCLTGDVCVNKPLCNTEVAAAETYCMPNKLPRGRLLLCSESMNNGDEKEVGLEIMWTSREQPTGPCQSLRRGWTG